MNDGRSGGIRTRDPHTPSVVRYQAALRSDPVHADDYNEGRLKLQGTNAAMQNVLYVRRRKCT